MGRPSRGLGPRESSRSAIGAIAIERFAALLVVTLLASCTNAVAQTFSTDVGYTAFYKTRSNPTSESEPTIALWWTCEQFEDAGTPLAKLRDYLLRHAELYPNSRHAERVASYLKVVERMLAEKRPASENRIDQLIFDLRYLNQGRVASDDAADQLREIGYDCVPALIDHIDDDTLTRTRSVDRWGASTFTDRILTVGECCRQILDFILPTGRQFELGDNPEATKRAMKNHYLHLITQKRAEP